MKKVYIEAKMKQGFRVDCQAGNHQVVIDQPTNSGGTDAAPTPLEYLFVSLAGCFCAVGRIIAIQRRINLRGMTVILEGELDPDSLLGKKTNSRTGFPEITVSANIDADLSMDEKEKLLDEIERRCPISDNINNPTSLNVKLVSNT